MYGHLNEEQRLLFLNYHCIHSTNMEYFLSHLQYNYTSRCKVLDSYVFYFMDIMDLHSMLDYRNYEDMTNYLCNPNNLYCYHIIMKHLEL